MSLNKGSQLDRMLPPGEACDFTVSTQGLAPCSPGDFLRIQGKGASGKEIIRFRINLSPEARGCTPVLHTDLKNGSWTEIPFQPLEIGSSLKNKPFFLDFPLPAGGYFYFRFFLEKEIDGLIERFWEADEYHKLLIDPPIVRNLRMYTLLPTVSGKISDWSKDLTHIANMGFNGIHILPFTAMGSSESPYSAIDYFSIDPHYLLENGDFEDFNGFLKRAAALNISICFDIVLNHVSNESRIAQEHGNWLIADPERADGFKRAGCWHQGSWISWEDLVLINFDHPDPQIKQEIFDYMRGYLLFWLDKAETCGAIIRLDNLHSSNDEFIQWLLSEIRIKKPSVPVLSEFFGSREAISAGVKLFGLNMITANTWESPFVPMLKDYLENLHAEKNPVKYFLSPTSHDTATATELFGSTASSIPRYFCCALMGTGQTGIVQGFEWGWEEKINFIGRQGRKDYHGNEDFTTVIGQINRLLESDPLFEKKGIRFLETGDDSLIVAIREDKESGNKILLGANFNIAEARDYHPDQNADLEEELLYRSDIIKDAEERLTSIRINSCGIFVFRIS